MDPPALRAALEEALVRLDVEIRREALPTEARIVGGLCTIRGRRVLILAPGAPLAEQIAILRAALRRLDTSALWLPPAVRELLDEG